jgi:hypothetical protein
MTFCLIGSFSLITDGSGIEKISKSVAKLIADEKYHTGSVSRHHSAVLGTMKLIGRHEMPRRVIWTHAQRPTATMDQRQIFWTLLDSKIRRNCNRKDSLTTFMPML